MQESLQREAEKAAAAAEQAMENLSRADAAASSDPASAQETLEKALADLTKNGLQKKVNEKLMKQGLPSTMEVPPGRSSIPIKSRSSRRRRRRRSRRR